MAAFCVGAAGYLNNRNDSLNNRGSNGYYWSSTQYSPGNCWHLGFDSGYSNMSDYFKALGFSACCLRD